MSLNLSSPTKLTRATIEQLDEIFGHFYNCREWFPHIRKDYVERNILAGNVIYDSGVIIIFNQYKRRQRIGNVEAQRGDFILHQILNPYRNVDKRINASEVMKQFCAECAADVYLSVREENERACHFYLKNGFEQSGRIAWSNGTLPGLVFIHRAKK